MGHARCKGLTEPFGVGGQWPLAAGPAIRLCRCARVPPGLASRRAGNRSPAIAVRRDPIDEVAQAALRES